MEENLINSCVLVVGWIVFFLIRGVWEEIRERAKKKERSAIYHSLEERQLRGEVFRLKRRKSGQQS